MFPRKNEYTDDIFFEIAHLWAILLQRKRTNNQHIESSSVDMSVTDGDQHDLNG